MSEEKRHIKQSNATQAYKIFVILREKIAILTPFQSLFASF